MNNNRLFFLMLSALLGMLLWQAWDTDYNRPKPPQVTGENSASANANEAISPSADVPGASSAVVNGKDVPTAAALPTPSATLSASADSAAAKALSQKIRVKTDLLEVLIDSQGGTVVEAALLNYAKVAGKPERVKVFSAAPDSFYVAQSGLIGTTGSAAPSHRDSFAVTQSEFALRDGQNELSVPMTWTDATGVRVTKTFTFKRGSYQIGVRHQVANGSSATWTGSFYQQLQRLAPAPPKGGMFAGMSNPEAFSFTGSAWYSPDEKFEKRKLDDEYMEEPLKRNFAGGWIAMVQHYFFSAWIPSAKDEYSHQTDWIQENGSTRYLIRAISPAITVPVGIQGQFDSSLFVGPKLQKQLPNIAPGLGLVSDYGMVTVLAEPLFWLLDKLYFLVKNWGIAIILLTLLVKLAFFKLSEAQYRSAAKMRKLQPRIQALKERYGDDRQKMSQAMLELQQKEKVNPLGGCLPLLITFPVFIALYWVLLESVEIRHAPFMAWIHNLTAPDPYFVLPVLNVLIMWLTQKLTPMIGMDPIQQKMFAAMPFVFGILFAFFPAGLVLYWVVNGGLGLIQQQIITKRVEAGDVKTGEAKA